MTLCIPFSRSVLVSLKGIGEENDEEEEQVPSKLCTFYSAR